MSRTIFGTKKIVKIDKHTRSKYTESDISWEKFKIFICVVLFILYIYFIIQPQIHFEQEKLQKMIIAEELKSERDKRLIKEHKKRMYDMRFFSLEWQAIHQKRWDGKDCSNDTCDCEESDGQR